MRAAITAAAVAGAGLLVVLAGCAGVEPYDRRFTWRPTGANEANLAAMAANPADLAHGHAQGPADGQLAAMAVERLRLGHVKPLTGANDGGGASMASGPAGN